MANVVGQTLPEIKLGSSSGGDVQLPDDIKGNWTVMYFYPKDDTPGCTKQACNYRDNIEKFNQSNIHIFGISMDNLDSHGKFIDKYSLNFPLLADTEHKLSDFFGVYGDQEFRGKVYKGIARDSFLIDPTGKVVKEWRGVDPMKTVEETFDAAVEAMGKGL